MTIAHAWEIHCTSIHRVDCQMFNDVRSWPRNFINTTASVTRKDGSISTCRMRNLSAGGVLLSCGEDLAAGCDYHVVLNLPGLQPIEVNGRLVRIQTDPHGHNSYGIAFQNVDPDTEDRIHNFLLLQLEHRYNQTPFALVVDDCVNTRRALERDLRAIGVSTVLAAMPLDALRILSDQNLAINLAIVDLKLGPADGVQLLKYLEKQHPTVRRVLISGQQRTCQLELAVKFGHAHAVLPKPWKRDHLKEVIGRLFASGEAA